MQTVTTFSGESVAKKSQKTNWADFADGNIYKAVKGQDFDTIKGFVVSMSRWANSNDYTAERYVNEDEGTVEFRLTPLSTPVDNSAESAESTDVESTDPADNSPEF